MTDNICQSREVSWLFSQSWDRRNTSPTPSPIVAMPCQQIGTKGYNILTILIVWSNRHARDTI